MTRCTSGILAVLAICLAAASPRAAQAQSPSKAMGRVQVFLDCPTFLCDFDFLRTEITFVDYVRERTAADVHVLVTTQGTGGGGTEYAINLVGQRRFSGSQDTLLYNASRENSQDATRRGFAGILKLALVRYAIQTEDVSKLGVTFAAPATGAAAPHADA